jgi:glutaminyl-tRNA synthetase
MFAGWDLTWKHERYASDYFGELYEYATKLIKKGLAYVDDSTVEEMAASKERLPSQERIVPYRNRSWKRTSSCSSE